MHGQPETLKEWLLPLTLMEKDVGLITQTTPTFILPLPTQM